MSDTPDPDDGRIERDERFPICLRKVGRRRKSRLSTGDPRRRDEAIDEHLGLRDQRHDASPATRAAVSAGRNLRRPSTIS